MNDHPQYPAHLVFRRANLRDYTFSSTSSMTFHNHPSFHKKMFADDTKAYVPLINDNDCLNLQETIDKLVEWSEKWPLRFNSSKCKVLHLGKNNHSHKYTIKEDNIINILEVTNVKMILVYMLTRFRDLMII